MNKEERHTCECCQEDCPEVGKISYLYPIFDTYDCGKCPYKVRVSNRNIVLKAIRAYFDNHIAGRVTYRLGAEFMYIIDELEPKLHSDDVYGYEFGCAITNAIEMTGYRQRQKDLIDGEFWITRWCEHIWRISTQMTIIEG